MTLRQTRTPIIFIIYGFTDVSMTQNNLRNPESLLETIILGSSKILKIEKMNIFGKTRAEHNLTIRQINSSKIQNMGSTSSRKHELRIW